MFSLLLKDLISDFYSTSGVVVSARTWNGSGPLTNMVSILDFLRYRISTETTRGMLSKPCIWIPRIV